jgi:NTE family protein
MRQDGPVEAPDAGGAVAGPALVLSGGGALGAFQAGFLRALFRTGFAPSLIVGTSAGAMNGAFIAFHPHADGADSLAGIWRALRSRSLFAFNPLRVAFQFVSQQLCIANASLLQELIERHMPVDDIAAANVPLYITATNLTEGRKAVFHAGPVSQAVLASTALPGIFCPVEMNGQLYVDGGVLANLDLETAIDAGASEILAIDLSRCIDGRRPDSIVGLWLQTLDVVQRERVDREMERLAGRARITLVQPGLSSPFALTSFSGVDRLLEEGERFAEEALARYALPDGRLRPGIIHEPIHLHP